MFPSDLMAQFKSRMSMNMTEIKCQCGKVHEKDSTICYDHTWKYVQEHIIALFDRDSEVSIKFDHSDRTFSIKMSREIDVPSLYPYDPEMDEDSPENLKQFRKSVLGALRDSIVKSPIIKYGRCSFKLLYELFDFSSTEEMKNLIKEHIEILRSELLEEASTSQRLNLIFSGEYNQLAMFYSQMSFPIKYRTIAIDRLSKMI